MARMMQLFSCKKLATVQTAETSPKTAELSRVRFIITKVITSLLFFQENNNKANSPNKFAPKAPVKKSKGRSSKSSKSQQDLNEINKEKTEQSVADHSKSCGNISLQQQQQVVSMQRQSAGQ